MSRCIVATEDARLFDAARRDAAHRPVAAGTAVDAVAVPGRDVWRAVTVRGASPPLAGFMLEVDLRSDAAAAPEPVADPDAFCQLATDVARRTGVDRDFLMAFAWMLSDGLADMGAGGDAIGPFRFTAEAWSDTLADPRAASVPPRDRRMWRDQVELAALRVLRLNDALTAALSRPPLLGEIVFAHLAGTAPLLGDRRAATLGFPSVDAALAALGPRLDAGYLAAAALIDRQPAETRFVQAEADDPPWLKVARAEESRGVFEFPGADNNARISTYLRLSGQDRTTDDVPWCGAFVTFCLHSCNDAAAAASIPATPARAASWLSWGEPAPDGERPPGTVVVLRPQAANSSGHVGFLVEAAPGAPPARPGHILLLAGNQGTPERVCTLAFAEAEVAGYRRLPGTRVQTAQAPAPGRFRSLVPGGFFSATPTDLAVKRSIRTNNPGALNISGWQTLRPGFAGRTAPDAVGNVTAIYFTPEHGVASWYHLIGQRYGFAGTRFALRSLAQRYAGTPAGPAVEAYVAGWSRHSGGALTPGAVIDFADQEQMFALARAMFRLEAGEPSPLLDTQIRFAMTQEAEGGLTA